MKRWHHYLVCYDIRCTRRLQKVQRRVSRDALAVQLSVYYLNCTADTLDALVADLNALIAPEDDVRCYRVAAKSALAACYGSQTARHPTQTLVVLQ